MDASSGHEQIVAGKLEIATRFQRFSVGLCNRSSQLLYVLYFSTAKDTKKNQIQAQIQVFNLSIRKLG